MNHEEHVNQLKSEVRYIQEVVNVRGEGGLWLACTRGGLRRGSGALCFPRHVPPGFTPSGGRARAGCGARAPAEPQPLRQTGSGAEPSSLLTCLYRAVV